MPANIGEKIIYGIVGRTATAEKRVREHFISAYTVFIIGSALKKNT